MYIVIDIWLTLNVFFFFIPRLEVPAIVRQISEGRVGELGYSAGLLT